MDRNILTPMLTYVFPWRGRLGGKPAILIPGIPLDEARKVIRGGFLGLNNAQTFPLLRYGRLAFALLTTIIGLILVATAGLGTWSAIILGIGLGVLITAALDFLSTPMLRAREQRFLETWGPRVLLGPSPQELFMAEAGAIPHPSVPPSEAWLVHLAVNIYIATSLTDRRLRRMLYMAVAYQETGNPELLDEIEALYETVCRQ